MHYLTGVFKFKCLCQEPRIHSFHFSDAHTNKWRRDENGVPQKMCWMNMRWDGTEIKFLEHNST